MRARGTARSLRSGGAETASPAQDGARRATAGGVRFGLWLLAAGFAYAAQYSLVPPHRHERGAVLYAVAGALAVLANARPSEAGFRREAALDASERDPPRGRRKRAIAALGGVTVLAAAASIALLVAGYGYGAALALWITALATSMAAASLLLALEETVRNRDGAIAFRNYLVSPHVLGVGR